MGAAAPVLPGSLALEVMKYVLPQSLRSLRGVSKSWCGFFEIPMQERLAKERERQAQLRVP
ncbi:MAG TPA: hypothetical protein DIC51_06410 [Coxiellaceae bacterium]|nr:hypothetical protein [Coxiellaceae bacterium]